MKIYIDLLFLLNCWIDFCLIILVKLVLKRITSIKRIIISSIIGGITTFCVFLNINYIFLTTIKLGLSVIIVIVAFGYKDYLYTIKNFIYLFMIGVILGGVASFIKINFTNRYIYLFGLIIISPLITFFFYLQNKNIKKKYSLYYNVVLYFDDIKTLLCGYLDSGNRLRDPITKKYIIIVNKTKLKGINKIRSPMYVPLKTINKSSLIKCYKPDKLIINNKEYKEYLVGITNTKLTMDGVDCLLNNKLLEDL